MFIFIIIEDVINKLELIIIEVLIKGLYYLF